MSYDTLFRGGTVIDPAQNLDGRYDVAMRDGRIAAVLPRSRPRAAAEVLDVSGKLVLPGLIDTHAHVFQYVTGRFGLEADMCGVHSGVTTLVDQGGPSCMTLPAFREFVVKAKKTPRGRVPLGLSRRRHGRPLLPGALPARLHRRRRHGQVGAREPRHRQGLQGARRDRRLRALGHRGDASSPPRSARRRTCRSTSTSASSGRCPSRRANGVDPDTILEQVVPLLQARRHPRASLHPPSRRLRRPRAARCIRSSRRRSRAGSRPTSATARISATGWRASRSTPASCPTRSAPTCTATTRRCRSRAARPTSIPTRSTCSSATTRFSLVSAMTAMLALGLPLEQVVPMVTTNRGEDARHAGTRSARSKPGVDGRRVACCTTSAAAGCCRTTKARRCVAERMLTPAFCLRAGMRHDADASILPGRSPR